LIVEKRTGVVARRKREKGWRYAPTKPHVSSKRKKRSASSRPVRWGRGEVRILGLGERGGLVSTPFGEEGRRRFRGGLCPPKKVNPLVNSDIQEGVPYCSKGKGSNASKSIAGERAGSWVHPLFIGKKGKKKAAGLFPPLVSKKKEAEKAAILSNSLAAL